MAGKLNFGGGGAKSTPAAPTKKTAPAKGKDKEEVIEAKATVVKDTPAKASKSAPLAKRETTALATRHHDTGSGIEGEITQDDIRPPSIKLVNAMSKLHTEDDFPIGSVVLDKEYQLMDKNGEINFVVLRGMKLYQQKLDYQSDETPLRFATKAEVEENGGTTKWSQEAVDDETYYQSWGAFGLAIQAPEGTPEEELHRFPIEYDGTHWARVGIIVAGGAFKDFGSPILEAAVGKLRTAGGIFSGMWKLKTVFKKQQKGDNTWYNPVAKFAGIIKDEESLEFFRGLSQGLDLDSDESGED